MKKQSIATTILAITVCLFFLPGCSTNNQQNVLTSQEKNDGWTLLFDGKTMNGWHLFNRGTIASAWSVDNGMLICNLHAKDVKHGDLVTDNVYQDFDLQFDWKISKAGNSGVFINVQERPDLGTTFSTGEEYQLLDVRRKRNSRIRSNCRPMRICGSTKSCLKSIPAKNSPWSLEIHPSHRPPPCRTMLSS